MESLWNFKISQERFDIFLIGEGLQVDKTLVNPSQKYLQ